MYITKTQVEHLLRNLEQRLFKVPVGIIGGYHGGNLGDMALGMSVAEVLANRGIKSGLQTIYNLEKWPKTSLAIVGGGAIGYNDSLARVAKRYAGEFNKVALLGVDFNDKTYSQECIQLIKSAAYVSGRSKVQADRLIALTGRQEIYYHQDIAFSLQNDFCMKHRQSSSINSNKKLLINVVPLYAHLKNKALRPVDNYRLERPELYENFERMHQSYKEVIIATVKEALDNGYTVENLPFTPGDRAYGEFILQNLPVKHLPYYSDPLRMLKYMSTADWVLATRFHATIFALKLGVKLTPIAYARKNELMLDALGVARSQFLSTEDLAKGVKVPLPAIKIDNSRVANAENESLQAIEQCINNLYEANFKQSK